MKTSTSRKAGRVWIWATVLLLASTAVMAEKPEWAGRGKREDREDRRDYERDDRGDRGDRDRRDRDDDRDGDRRQRDRREGYIGQQGPSAQVRIGGYFDDRQRTEAHGYYRDQYRAGNCPPGLAKKNNGCMPPGQARQWNMGQPLPRDVQYYPVEPSIRARLGVPPAGYEFVRVASDILMIAVGTSVVMDAIQDLGR